MITRKRLIGLALIVVVGLAAWLSWRWYTAPVPPTIPLEGVNQEKAKKIEQMLQEVRDNPRSGKAWGELGLTLAANGFFEQSIPCFGHAQEFDPTDPHWPYFQGSLMLMFGRREGFDKLREALATAQSSTDRRAILFPLAQALVEDGQLDEAAQRAGELYTLEGEGPTVDYVFGLLAINRNDRATARTHLLRLVDHPSARKRACALLAGLVDDPQQADDYRRRANELPDDQPWPDSFEKELPRYRANPRLKIAPYYDLDAQGRHADAVVFLRELVAQSPDDESCYLLGSVVFKTEQFEEAAKFFRQAIGFNPQHAKSHQFLGASLLRLGEKRSQEADGKEKALDLFRQAVLAEDKALSIQNDLAGAHLARGRALNHLGRTNEAILALRQAVAVGTEDAEMHQALGEALAETGQLREGLEHLEDAVRLAKSDNPRPRQALEKWKAKAKVSP